MLGSWVEEMGLVCPSPLDVAEVEVMLLRGARGELDIRRPAVRVLCDRVLTRPAGDNVSPKAN